MIVLIIIMRNGIKGTHSFIGNKFLIGAFTYHIMVIKNQRLFSLLYLPISAFAIDVYSGKSSNFFKFH